MKVTLLSYLHSCHLTAAWPSLSQQHVPLLQGVTGFGSSIALVAVWVIAKNIGINAGEGCSNRCAAQGSPAVQGNAMAPVQGRTLCTLKLALVSRPALSTVHVHMSIKPGPLAGGASCSPAARTAVVTGVEPYSAAGSAASWELQLGVFPAQESLWIFSGLRSCSTGTVAGPSHRVQCTSSMQGAPLMT